MYQERQPVIANMWCFGANRIGSPALDVGLWVSPVSNVDPWPRSSFSSLSFVAFMKPGVEPSVDLASAMSMKLEFPGLSRSSISTSLHPIIVQS